MMADCYVENLVEIKYDLKRNVYLRVNRSEWIVKSIDDLTEYERILLRVLQPDCDSAIKSDSMRF